MIYFDNASTYKNDNKDVLNYFLLASEKYFANSNSSHHLGYLMNRKLLETRNNILKTLKLSNDYEIIFTSGASEANNLAIKGYCYKNKNRGNEIIVFNNEHASIINAVESLKEDGFLIKYISSDKNGKIRTEELKKTINNKTIMVIAMSINNEVGSINDITEIKSIVEKYPKCVFLSDINQSIGKYPMIYNDIDMLTFSAHKFGGIIGVGALIKKKKIQLKKLIDGGDQENNQRAGTTPLPLILSMNYALTNAIENIAENLNYVRKLKDHLVNKLSDIDEIIINSNSDFPYIVNFSLKKKKASVVIEALSNKEIYVSSLSACNAKMNKPSHVLLNMGKDIFLAENSIRVSFSSANTLDEVDTFIKELKSILGEIR